MKNENLNITGEIRYREFYVQGMHCSACELFVEKNLSTHKDIRNLKANLHNQKIRFETERNDLDNLFLEELNSMLADSDYRVVLEQPVGGKVNYKELLTAFIIATLFALGFLGLQKLGLVNFLNADTITLPFVFFIGVIASLSTCMAVVGGLVLSLSSTYSKEEGKGKNFPIILFHVSRLVSFFILGGVIGLLGSAFILTPVVTFVINLILFFVMVIMGINLLDVFPFAKKLQLSFPKVKGIANMDKNITNKFAPILLGSSTFFLPCGFTQSMQVYSLSTGSFINGALTMLFFALGTFPILALISFASVKFADTLKSKIFFKTAGFIILFFAIINFLGALTAIGIIRPILSI